MPVLPQAAVIFDLDGVLTDTAELHYQSWVAIAAEQRIPFDRRANEALRGLGRMESLEILLGAARFAALPPARRQALCDHKNADFLERVAHLSPRDVLPGVLALLADLQAAGLRRAIASSSRNAEMVVQRLGVREWFEVLVDGNATTASKPAPDLFLLAAQRLGVCPAQCAVVEDAASGIAAARAAGMRVVGVGPPERVGHADLSVASLEWLDAGRIRALLAP